MFGRYAAAATHGLPPAVYLGRAGTYRPDPDGVGTPTQSGPATAALRVGVILANSPRAKGRAGRVNGTPQDRLVRGGTGLRGVSDTGAPNALLGGKGGGFLAELNGRFAARPKQPKPDLRRRATAAMRLDEVLCVHEGRAVGRDWCVQWRGRLLQVDARHAGLDLPRPGRRVTVAEKADGSLLVRYGTATWREVVERPAPPKRPPVTNNNGWQPAADHPFRRRIVGTRGGNPDSSTALRTP